MDFQIAYVPSMGVLHRRAVQILSNNPQRCPDTIEVESGIKRDKPAVTNRCTQSSGTDPEVRWFRDTPVVRILSILPGTPVVVERPEGPRTKGRQWLSDKNWTRRSSVEFTGAGGPREVCCGDSLGLVYGDRPRSAVVSRLSSCADTFDIAGHIGCSEEARGATYQGTAMAERKELDSTVIEWSSQGPVGLGKLAVMIPSDWSMGTDPKVWRWRVRWVVWDLVDLLVILTVLKAAEMLGVFFQPSLGRLEGFGRGECQ